MPKKRREAAPRSLKRIVAIRRPRKTIVVFCEGEKTEPQYLQALKQQPSLRDVAAIDLQVEIGHGGDVPRTLVSLAVLARDRAAEEQDEVDEFWCVFDVEQPKNHPGLGEARWRAEANGIKLAISNPCFELWLILHFQSHGGWLDNDGARRLRRRLDGSADKSLDSAKYMPLIADAARRAAELEKRHHGDGVSFPDDNPSSGMHLLISAAEPPSP